MAKKIIFIFLLGFVITLIMFLHLVSDKKDIMIIGDSISIGRTDYDILTKSYIDYFYYDKSSEINNIDKTYSINNLTTKDVYEFIINNNKYGDEETIKQKINNSEIIFISIGIDEINNNANIKIYLYYLEKIINEIKIINENEVYLISLYSDKDIIKNVNESIENISIKYEINYVDISNIDKELYIIEGSYFLNEEGQKYIKNQIINIYEKNVN